jgi:hypothetical protein
MHSQVVGSANAAVEEQSVKVEGAERSAVSESTDETDIADKSDM